MVKTKKPSNSDPMPARSARIEDALMNSLKNSGLERSHLSELVNAASTLGVVPIKGFPYGIPNPEGVVIETRLNPKQLSSFMGRLWQYNQVHQVIVFPKGIPQVSEFIAQVYMK